MHNDLRDDQKITVYYPGGMFVGTVGGLRDTMGELGITERQIEGADFYLLDSVESSDVLAIIQH